MDPSCVRGDLARVRGDLAGVRGDPSAVRGDLTGQRRVPGSVRESLPELRGQL